MIDINNKKGNLVKFYLFQTNDKNIKYHSYSELKEEDFNPERYELVYSEERMMASINPEDEFLRFNGDNPRPSNYYGTSISISDVLLYIYDNEVYTFYCDPAGYNPIFHFATDHILITILNNYDVKKEYYDLINNGFKVERRNILKEKYLLPISLAEVRNLVAHNQDILIAIKNNSDTELIQYNVDGSCYLSEDFLHKFEYEYEQADKCLFDIFAMQKYLLDMLAEIEVRIFSSNEKNKYLKTYSDKAIMKLDLSYKKLYYIEKVKELIKEGNK